MDEMRQLAVRAWNASAGDGIATPWSFVPFNNGDDPTLAVRYVSFCIIYLFFIFMSYLSLHSLTLLSRIICLR
jgi:hypothetical protein